VPFTDTHVHFWDLSATDRTYDWLKADAGPDPVVGNYDAIKSQRYWPDDFLAETRFCGVEKVVHVQCATGSADPVAETAWLQSLADRVGIPQGIVAYADLAAPEVDTLLARHAEYANLRGIRDLRSDGYLTDERWERGYAKLERFNLVCCDDPLLEQMPAARELALRHPGITLCIDLAGFPRERTREYFERWRAGMHAIAEAENTVVKICGLGMADHRWTIESLRPWVMECIDAFGVARSFFGTNWPHDRLFSSYGDVVGAYGELISDFSASDQQALMSGNADRIFRLNG
jgi:predicted TIM-barrel fold metal-dependent hydrolase